MPAELTFDPYHAPYEYITELSRAEEVLRELMNEKVIAVDVESNGLDAYTSKLICVQIGTRTISYIFDARALNLKEIPLYKDLLENPNIVKLFQNGKFDYKFLKLQTGVVINNMYDTMLAEGVLRAGHNPDLGLGDIAGHYFYPGVIDKKLQSSFAYMTPNQNISEEQLVYAGTDTLILFPIFDMQIKELQDLNLFKVAKLEFAATVVVAEMELRGVYVNATKWREIIKSLEEKRDKFAIEFQEAIKPYYPSTQMNLFGGMADTININSNVQLMDLLNNKLGLDVPSTNDAFLQRVMNPIVDILRNYRGYSKLVSTYGEKLLEKTNPVTGRIHPEFLQIRAATGRFACNNPNLQNIPKNSEEVPFRSCFNPAPGYKLVVADYSNFEIRILADLANDENMLKMLNEGLDPHSYTASLMFDKPYSSDFKKLYPELRQMAKPIGFGLMYGMGAQGLIGRIYQETKKEISLEESEDLIKRFFKSYPAVQVFLEAMGKDAQRKGFSATPLGRKRFYNIPAKDDPDYRKKMSSIAREAKNHPIQGTNADAIKFALVFLQERLTKDNVDGFVVSTVHDEIVCEVREDQAQDFSKVLSDEMVRAANLFLKKVKIVSEPFVGDVWEH